MLNYTARFPLKSKLIDDLNNEFSLLYNKFQLNYTSFNCSRFAKKKLYSFIDESFEILYSQTEFTYHSIKDRLSYIELISKINNDFSILNQVELGKYKKGWNDFDKIKNDSSGTWQVSTGIELDNIIIVGGQRGNLCYYNKNDEIWSDFIDNPVKSDAYSGPLWGYGDNCVTYPWITNICLFNNKLYIIGFTSYEKSDMVSPMLYSTQLNSNSTSLQNLTWSEKTRLGNKSFSSSNSERSLSDYCKFKIINNVLYIICGSKYLYKITADNSIQEIRLSISNGNVYDFYTKDGNIFILFGADTSDYFRNAVWTYNINTDTLSRIYKSNTKGSQFYSVIKLNNGNLLAHTDNNGWIAEFTQDGVLIDDSSKIGKGPGLINQYNDIILYKGSYTISYYNYKTKKYGSIPNSKSLSGNMYPVISNNNIDYYVFGKNNQAYFIKDIYSLFN